MTIKNLIPLLSILCVIACNRTPHVNEADEKFTGTYKKGSDNYRETLHLRDNYLLSSEYVSRMFPGEVFEENGTWKVMKDTLFIERVRHETLKAVEFPANQKYLIRENKLFEIERNYKGELFKSPFYFEKECSDCEHAQDTTRI